MFGDEPPLERDGETTIAVSKYYYLNGLRVANAVDGELTWIHSDHLHSATIITDAGGAEIRRLAYRAFGEEAENVGSGDAPKYRYTGKELDSFGLMYYGARYYDPALARFITPDTLYDRGPQGLNRYSYVLNNPIRYNDPSGHYISGPDDDENPTGYGTVTGSAEQLHDGSATVHDYYGTHKLSYWNGLAGQSEPETTNSDMLLGVSSVYLNTALTGIDDFVVEPILDKTDRYLQSKGYDNVQKAVLILSLAASLDDGNLKKLKKKTDDLVTVFHFTNKKGYKSITSGKDITIKASKPPANNPVGAYFSKEGPTQLKNKSAAKLRISAEKTEYVIEAQVPRSILKEKRGRHRRIVYSPHDVTILQGYWKGYKNPYFKE